MTRPIRRAAERAAYMATGSADAETPRFDSFDVTRNSGIGKATHGRNGRYGEDLRTHSQGR
jgi:hypothetical protein